MIPSIYAITLILAKCLGYCCRKIQSDESYEARHAKAWELSFAYI